MTKDEIKKALKMCADSCFRVCCPYGAVINCCGKLKRDALDLITEQEQEIEQLKAAKNDWKQRYESVDKKYMTFIASSTECIKKKVKQAKIDVLKGLREKYATSGSVNNNWATIIFVDDIDELIKEVENE